MSKMHPSLEDGWPVSKCHIPVDQGLSSSNWQENEDLWHDTLSSCQMKLAYNTLLQQHIAQTYQKQNMPDLSVPLPPPITQRFKVHATPSAIQLRQCQGRYQMKKFTVFHNQHNANARAKPNEEIHPLPWRINCSLRAGKK